MKIKNLIVCILCFLIVFSSDNSYIIASTADGGSASTGKLKFDDRTGSLLADIKGVTLATTSIKYRTIGWKFTVFTAGGQYTTLMKVDGSNFYPVGPSNNGKQDYEMKFKFLPSNSETSACQQNSASCNWNRSIIDNFMLEYANNSTAKNQIAGVLMNGGTIQADAIMTTVVNGTEKGSIRDNAKWKDSNKYSGIVYDTQAGILNAASWGQASKNDLYTKYYNLYIDFPALPVPITGELITRYFELDENNKVVAALQVPNSQIIEIDPTNGTAVTAPYKDFSGLNYKGYSAPATDNIGIGGYNSVFKSGKDISITLTKTMTTVYVNYFYKQDTSKPYLESTLIVNPETIDFQGEDMKVDVTVKNEIKNLSDPNKIQSWDITAFKDKESNLAQKKKSNNKTLTLTHTFEFMIPKGVMDGVAKYVEKFTSKTEVKLTDGSLIAIRNGEAIVMGDPPPPEPPPQPKAQITINGLTVEDDRPQTPAGWWGANTVQMIAGKSYFVQGAGIPGDGYSIVDFQWSLDQVDYSQETLIGEWDGLVVYPVSTIGTYQEIFLGVTDNLGQSARAKMYAQIIAPPPKADFIANPNPGIAGDTIQLINKSVDYNNAPLKTVWNIVNPLGESSSLTTWDGKIENAIEGKYTVTLMVENEKGLDSITKTIDVYGPPSVQITNPISTDANLPDILYSNVGITWDYIKNELAQRGQQQFEVIIKKASDGSVIATSGVMNSTLFSWKPEGLQSNVTYSAEVRVSDGRLWSEWSEQRYFVYNHVPVAQFDAPNAAYIDETLVLTNQSTDEDLTPAQYQTDLNVLWTIEYPNGDINTFTDWDITLTNLERGEYKATLQVSDAYGGFTVTMPKTIKVYGLPTATITDPISEDAANPTIYTISSPTVKWDYEHPDNLAQQKFEVNIYKENGALETSSGIVSSSNDYWKVFNLNGGQTYKVQVRVNDGNRWSAWATTKYFKVNSPPVADFKTDKESYFERETIKISNLSYDLDGDILQMKWNILEPTGMSRTIDTTTLEDVVIPNAPEGMYSVRLTATDVYGETSTKQQEIYVNSGKIEAKLNIGGTLKVNRKITMDSLNSTEPSSFPILQEKTTFTIVPVTQGITTLDIKPEATLTGLATQDILVKKEGLYKVTLYIENILGFTDTAEETIYVAPDVEPKADFTATQNIFRDPNDGNWAKIDILDQSSSPDDVIKERIWTITYNADNNKDMSNNPIFSDDIPLVIKNSDLSEGVETPYTLDGLSIKITRTGNNLKLKVPDVGRYLVDLEVIEDFSQPTLSTHITDLDYLRDSTSDKSLTEKIVTVWNKKPTVQFKD